MLSNILNNGLYFLICIATGQHAVSWVDDRDGNEQLVRQVARFKAKAGAMEELASIYRTSVTAIYSDGSSYGAAQFEPIAQEG